MDPAFRILDDAEDARLLDEAADEAIDALYEEGGEALSRLDTGRGPQKKCANWPSASTPFSANARTPRRGWNAPSTARRPRWRRGWMNWCAPPAARWTRRWPPRAPPTTTPAVRRHYAAALEKDMEALEALRALDGAEALSQAMRAFKQARPSGRNRDVAPEDLEAVKALRKSAGDGVKNCRLCKLSIEQAREDALALYDLFPVLADAAPAHRRSPRPPQGGARRPFLRGP